MLLLYVLFFFSDTATPDIYTLSLHDALPIWLRRRRGGGRPRSRRRRGSRGPARAARRRRAAPSRSSRPRGLPDRKSTRLNSSHSQISYAVFCLKKKKRANPRIRRDSRHTSFA